MNQERTIAKLMLEINEFELNIRTALQYAYAAGYDERGMDLNAHNTSRVFKFSAKGDFVREYGSIRMAASKNGLSRSTVTDILKGKRRLTPDKKFYFQYTK